MTVSEWRHDLFDLVRRPIAVAESLKIDYL